MYMKNIPVTSINAKTKTEGKNLPKFISYERSWFLQSIFLDSVSAPLLHETAGTAIWPAAYAIAVIVFMRERKKKGKTHLLCVAGGNLCLICNAQMQSQ